MAQTKKTKKFERHNLQDTIKRRKDFAKVKQRHQQAAKRKSKRVEDAAPADPKDVSKSRKDTSETTDFADMNVDEFFEGGIEVPTAPKKRKQADTPLKPKKKRATSPSEADSDASEEAAPVVTQNGEAHSESDSDDDLEAHKAQLDALAEQDPEFHKYLQENDPELLELENVDLDGLDDASDPEFDQAEGKSRKKDKSDQNDVTKAMVKKWTAAMKDQHSLRAAREVVLAFRAAANTNEEKEQAFKYTISSPQVYHELLMAALNHIPSVLEHHLPVKVSQNGKVYVH